MIALYLALVVLVLVDGPEVGFPDWAGISAVMAPIWVAILLWGPIQPARRRLLVVVVVALAVCPIVPIDAGWSTRLAVALLAAVLLVVHDGRSCRAAALAFMAGVVSNSRDHAPGVSRTPGVGRADLHGMTESGMRVRITRVVTRGEAAL